MSKDQKVVSAAYRKIAIDIAKNISDGKYTEGQKLFGRSVLSSQYGVSPETIRKAIYILKDVGILDTEKGSGITVESTVKAREFIKLQNEVGNIAEIKAEILSWAKEQTQEIADIAAKVQSIADAAEKIKNIGPFAPYELRITENAQVIGKSADELRFWHNTGGTIIAIRRSERLILSPGPYATFNKGDIFYIIGSEEAYSAAMNLLYGTEEHSGEQED